ncbi:MAG: hypothetical protein ACTHJS_12580 [Xanthobacteraceae bacterium]
MPFLAQSDITLSTAYRAIARNAGGYSSFADMSEPFNLFQLIRHGTPLLGKVEVLSPNIFVCRQQRMAITVGGVLFTNISASLHCLDFALLRTGPKFFYRGLQGARILETALRQRDDLFGN